MSTSASPAASSGRGLAVLWSILVVLVAMIAASVTVVVSQRTYAPTASADRTLDPAVQVAAGRDHVDDEAGLVVRVPEGWETLDEDLVFGTTAMFPEGEPASGGDAAGDAAGDAGPPDSGGFALVGALTPNLFASRAADNQRAAAMLISGMAEFFLPIAGRVSERRMEEISSDVGDGWALSMRVTPTERQNLVGPDGAIVYTAVVGEGDRRYWLTYFGIPADGTVGSPEVDWADEIVERFEPAGPARPGVTTA